MNDAANHESGSGQDDGRKRDFTNNQSAQQPTSLRRLGGRRAGLLERLGQARPGGSPGGSQAEDNARDDRKRQCRRKHGSIEGQWFQSDAAQEGAQRLDAPMTQNEAAQTGG